MTSPKPIQIFKPGRHTAMSGAVLDFTEADLSASAAAYDPAKHEAPLVVGHPRHDAPAYGWVKSLAFAEGLEAEPHQVDEQFAEMVASGRFKKISASWYTPDSPQNPVPGVYYLRHVGFLGAQPPAVKGLRAPEFADNEEGVVEFADWSDMQNATLWRRMREWIIGRFGLDEADKVIPDYSVGSLEDAARSAPADDPAPSYSDPPTDQHPQETQVTPEEKAALEAENARLKQELADANARDKAAQARARHAGHAAFAEDLAKAGKLLPAQKDFIVAFMDYVSEDGGVIEFGEGSAKQSKAGIDGFKEFLSALPKQVEFSEVARSQEGTAGTVSFAAPAGYGVDAERLELHTKALEYQRAHNVAYDQALAAVSQ